MIKTKPLPVCINSVSDVLSLSLDVHGGIQWL